MTAVPGLRKFLATALVALAGCSEFTAPHGAAPVLPIPQHYRDWWADLERCSGLRGDVDRVRFYVAPRMEPASRGAYTTLRAGAAPLVVIRAGLEGNEQIVRHEMMHALGRFKTHPPRYFSAECGIP